MSRLADLELRLVDPKSVMDGFRELGEEPFINECETVGSPSDIAGVIQIPTAVL